MAAQVRERHVSKPEREAVKRFSALEAGHARYRDEAAHLARGLAEMREDRDRWRSQAEKLAAALERLRGPAAIVTTHKIEGSDHLHGWKAIAGHLGIKPDAARHLARMAGLPVNKIGTKTIGASRKAIDSWVSQRVASTAQGNI